MGVKGVSMARLYRGPRIKNELVPGRVMGRRGPGSGGEAAAASR